MSATITETPQLPRGGRPGFPETHWKNVAKVYDHAMKKGLPPRLAVADHWGRPLSTAGRWVERARAKGYLPETIPGLRAGNVKS